jgi:RNA polymerase sigma factor (sigma-70 family)
MKKLGPYPRISIGGDLSLGSSRGVPLAGTGSLRDWGALGEEGGFEEWYQDQHRRLLGAMVLAAGDVDVAREVTDEAFARALERWPRVRGMKSPSGWTYATALNALRRRIRRQAFERRLLARRTVTEASTPSPELGFEVWDAVRSLAPRERTAIALRYVSGLRESDIADVLGVAPGTVARTLHDARQRLAERLADPLETTPALEPKTVGDEA